MELNKWLNESILVHVWEREKAASFNTSMEKTTKLFLLQKWKPYSHKIVSFSLQINHLLCLTQFNYTSAMELYFMTVDEKSYCYGLVSLFNGISIFMGYLMLKSSLKNSSSTI